MILESLIKKNKNLLQIIIKIQSIIRGNRIRKKVKSSKPAGIKRNNLGTDINGKYNHSQTNLIVLLQKIFYIYPLGEFKK